jgi:hypothetical protein
VRDGVESENEWVSAPWKCKRIKIYCHAHVVHISRNRSKTFSLWPVSMWMFMRASNIANYFRFLFLFDTNKHIKFLSHLSLNGQRCDAKKCEIFIAIEMQFLFQFRQITYPWTCSQWSLFRMLAEQFSIEFYELFFCVLDVHPSVMHALHATATDDKKF